MTIVRIVKHERRYVSICNDVLEMENLSWEAKGLWSYLLSRPPNWEPNIAHLTAHFPSGKDRLYRIFQELEGVGLCSKTQERLPNGLMGKFLYTIYEDPQLNKSLPHTEKPEAEKPLAEKPTHNKDREKIKTEKNNKEREGARAPNSSSEEKKILRKEEVYTTPSEHSKLIHEFGEEKTREAYVFLSEWKLDTPKSKWKKSDYRSVRRWVIEALKERELKQAALDKASSASSSPTMSPQEAENRNTNMRKALWYRDKYYSAFKRLKKFEYGFSAPDGRDIAWIDPPARFEAELRKMLEIQDALA